MTILDTIIENKKKEIQASKKLISLEQLSASKYYYRQCLNFADSIRNKNGIIAEFKRKSPSKGIINGEVFVVDVVKGYENAGVSAISVLTDTVFFGGTFNDVLLARETVAVPILRKDFMVDEYQLHEAKAMGADVILLIASGLSKLQSQDLSGKAKELGLNVFLEIHNDGELAYIEKNIDVVGVNNRDLKTFKVDIENAIRLAQQIPNHLPKVAESGISSPEMLLTMKSKGFTGFLIGENFMKTNNPGLACKKFAKACNAK